MYILREKEESEYQIRNEEESIITGIIEKHKLLKLTPEEIENLSTSFKSKEVELLIQWANRQIIPRISKTKMTSLGNIWNM